MFAVMTRTGATSGSSVAASPSMTVTRSARDSERRSLRRSRSRRGSISIAATCAAPSFAAAIASTALPVPRSATRSPGRMTVVQQTHDAARRCVLARSERHARLDDDRAIGIAILGEPRRHDRQASDALRANSALPLLRPVDVGKRFGLHARLTIGGDARHRAARPQSPDRARA